MILQLLCPFLFKTGISPENVCQWNICLLPDSYFIIFSLYSGRWWYSVLFISAFIIFFRTVIFTVEKKDDPMFGRTRRIYVKKKFFFYSIVWLVIHVIFLNAIQHENGTVKLFIGGYSYRVIMTSQGQN